MNTDAIKTGIGFSLACLKRLMGVSPMIAVCRDFSRYNDQTNKSEASTSGSTPAMGGTPMIQQRTRRWCRACEMILFAPGILSMLFLQTSKSNAQTTKPASTRIVRPFDTDWRFIQQNVTDAEKSEIDDTHWRQLNVPHDWSIEAPAAADNSTGASGGFFASGIGWYRKQFKLSEADSNKKIFIDFDSVMANSDVWINGHSLGHRPSGYVPLHYELTGNLNFGPDNINVLAVKVDQSAQPSSRYYTGAGIIGHVHLTVENAVHFAHHGLFVSTPKAEPSGAEIHVQTVIENQSDSTKEISVRVQLMDPDGRPMATRAMASAPQEIAAGASVDWSQDITISDPKMWDLEHPQLYQAKITLLDGNSELDDDQTAFGIRTIKFDPATGFSLNGKNIRVQGVCLHADASCFGTAVPVAAWEQRLSALKPFGVNALRTAHNPPTPEFLDLCDRMGFLVMDEMFDCWDVAKNPHDYHLYFDQWSLTDLREAVRRDRNHPSIILYSAGNEIHDTPKAEASIKILSGLMKEFHASDPTRLVTQALLRPNVSHDYIDGLADLLDVVGTNYRMTELLAAQKAKPTRLIIGTENHIGDVPFLATHPPLAGIFIWAGVDYLGEARAWPQIANSSGLFDRTNQPRASAYFARATWSETPFVHVARGASRAGPIPLYAPGADGDEPAPPTTTPVTPGARRRRPAGGGSGGPGPGPSADWSPANRQPHAENVWVYSNCPKVGLMLNGVAIPANADASASPNGTHTFSVPFAPGVLNAVAMDAAGKIVASDELHSAGVAAKIALSCDLTKLPHNFDEVAFVRASVTDADGNVVPTSDHDVSFTITGPGVVAATDSGDNNYHDPFASAHRLAFEGRCVAMVKSTADAGGIALTATSPGLASASINIEAAPSSR